MHDLQTFKVEAAALAAEVEALREIAQLAQDVRAAQRKYFSDRTQANLTTSKMLERMLDQRLTAYAAPPAPEAAQAGMVV